MRSVVTFQEAGRAVKHSRQFNGRLWLSNDRPVSLSPWLRWPRIEAPRLAMRRRVDSHAGQRAGAPTQPVKVSFHCRRLAL